MGTFVVALTAPSAVRFEPGESVVIKLDLMLDSAVRMALVNAAISGAT